MRYPPEGSRSVSLAQPVARYGATPLTEHLAASNHNVLAVGQFETADYATDLEQAMKYLDVAFIGPVDLSVDLGTAGELYSAPMTAAISAVEAAAQNAGTPMGTFAGTPEAVRSAQLRGYPLHRALLGPGDARRRCPSAQPELTRKRVSMPPWRHVFAHRDNAD